MANASDCIWGPKSLPASADLTNYQFCFMKIDTNGQLALPALGGLAWTVLQDTPNAQGEPGLCCRPGDITRVYTAGAVNAGSYVSTDANGKAITTVSGDYILGIFLDTTSVAGIVRVLYQPMGGKL